MNPAPNLFFVGPMGAGKTTIGRRVADLLGLPFFDLDHEIEEHTGATIPLIFDLEGETGFRERERSVLADFAARGGVVLATGGGAVLAEENRERLRKRGFVVYLETTIDDQLARLARDRKRPLLAAPDRRERLRALAAIRDPLYREVADLTVPASRHRNVVALARQLAGELEQRWQRGPAPEQAA
jgi:shikimate kinase